MSEKKLWLETDYFEKFRCKGGSCRNSCCEGWRIAVSMKEYFHLIGMDCSDDMHHRLECAFCVPDEPSPERYRMIAPNWLGKCPLHGDDGLCMLQKECGEAALPEICRVYPRSMKCENGINQACCSASCEAVVEILMKEEKLHFQFAEMEADPEYEESSKIDIAALGAACMKILQNREINLAQRIADICDYISSKPENIPEKNLDAALMLANDQLMGIMHQSEAVHRFGERAAVRYNCPNPAALYRADCEDFARRFPRWEVWFENIIANHFIYEDFPCVDRRLNPDQTCAGLCMLYALMRILCVACCGSGGGESDIADNIAGIFRLVEHSAFYYNAHIMAREYMQLLLL